MKKGLLLLIFVVLLSSSGFSQDCFTPLQEKFDKRGSYSVSDGIHKNITISYFEDGGSRCVAGKARVENGKIVSLFMQNEDGTFEILDTEFYNSKRSQPEIINGISEMIYNLDAEKFKIVFIDQLKPK